MTETPATAVLGTGSAARALEVRWRGDDAGLAALRGEWNALLARSASDTVFLTWEWIECWWRHFGGDSALWAGEIRDGEGMLRGIAPLKCRRRRGRLGACRVVEFIGAGGPALPDHLDFIFEHGWEEPGLAAVMEALDRRAAEWDLIVLSELDEDPEEPGGGRERSPARAVTDWARSRRRWMHRFRSTVCPYLPLPGTWDELLRGFRGELRQGAPVKIRRCERRGVRLVARESSGELDAAMDDLARLHQLRMEDTERGGNFRNPAYLAFHRDLMNAFAARGWLDLRFLELDGERIAVEYGFRYGRRFHWYQLGFDPKWSSLSPGMVILAMRARELIAEGFTEFDMLRGRSVFKSKWTRRYRLGITAIIPARGARGVRAWLSDLLSLPAPIIAKRLIPAALFESLVDARRGGVKGPRPFSRRGHGSS